MAVFSVDTEGYFGEFGGAYVPEILQPNIDELKNKYLQIIAEPKFQQEFKDLLQKYVGRPTPLYFASRLSEHFQTNIFLKREDLCHTGAHKINNTIGQILIAEKLGKKKIVAETGAGQHGVATATACALKGLECVIYMGEKDIERQAPNVSRMKMLGAQIIAAKSGSKTLKDATNEAFRHWMNNPYDTHYIIGSAVGPHPYPDMAAKFQAVISEEIKNQMNGLPNHVIACVGGGSNAIGTFYHFLEDKNVKLYGIEAAGLGIKTNKTAATLELGSKGILHGSKTFVIQDAFGQVTEPHSISAGLDYPGIGPAHAHLKQIKRVQYPSITDNEAMEAGFFLSKTEGIIPAIESAHAVAYLKHLKAKKEETVVINISGRGDKDIDTYMKFL